jgi:hypothetical protein
MCCLLVLFISVLADFSYRAVISAASSRSDNSLLRFCPSVSRLFFHDVLLYMAVFDLRLTVFGSAVYLGLFLTSYLVYSL